MERTRREVVGLLASVGLAGCTGAGVPSLPSNPLGADGGTTPAPRTATPSTGASEANATATPTTPTATPRPDDPGATTRRVFDGVEWFATRYEREVERFRSLAARTRNVADSLSRRSSVDSEGMATLERLAGRIETVAYDRLGPHFDASPSIRSFNRDRIGRARTLRRRGDWDALATVLGEVADRYETYASAAYVERTFPRDPVRGPLVRHATAPDHAGDVVFLAYHVGSDAEVRVQRTPDTYEGTPPGGRADLNRYRTLFGPLSAGAGGESGMYVTLTGLLGDRSLPLSIRRYRDGDAAAAAVADLLDGGVTAERTVRPEGREWRRVFYRSEGDVMYAELTRAGPFVLAAGPSRTPWEDRPSGWRLPMELSWLGG